LTKFTVLDLENKELLTDPDKSKYLRQVITQTVALRNGFGGKSGGVNMMKNKQAGNTLIFVLIILLLITIIGTWAIRGAITSLNITTNAQAQALLVQNSDAVFFQLESYADDAVKIAKLQLDNGMIGYVNKPENKGKELVYCLRKVKKTINII
jgi:Tfp pilus assembly protein PilE